MFFLLQMVTIKHLKKYQKESFLVISNIADGSLDFSNTRYVQKNIMKKYKWKPKRGDILFSVTGSYGIVVNIKN